MAISTRGHGGVNYVGACESRGHVQSTIFDDMVTCPATAGSKVDSGKIMDNYRNVMIADRRT